MRIVIKIGTSTLAHKTGRLNIRRVEELCKVISDLKNADITESLAMKNYLVSKGINSSNIIEEDKATNTFENIRYSKKILDNIKIVN